MPFGRHKGQPLAAVPADYLRWVLANCRDIRPLLRHAIEHTLTGSRSAAGDSTDRTTLAVAVEKIVRAAHRQMTMRYHPDRGGSHEAMVAINDMAETLRRLAREGAP